MQTITIPDNCTVVVIDNTDNVDWTSGKCPHCGHNSEVYHANEPERPIKYISVYCPQCGYERCDLTAKQFAQHMKDLEARYKQDKAPAERS